ncbi:MAG: hypothetical protein ACRDBG_22680 [Waterburya sp.]
MGKSTLESKFIALWDNFKSEEELELAREVRLVPSRRYKFDFVHKESRVAIEINGGTWGIGGHSSGKGLNRDYEKLNLAQMHGFLVFQLSSSMITLDWVERIREAIYARLSKNS